MARRHDRRRPVVPPPTPQPRAAEGATATARPGVVRLRGAVYPFAYPVQRPALVQLAP
ncbi:hypothetical protein [Mycolicibacterium doricum]|uniref:hypothetical protein n=1 Tax=Mycolicibacterium doricum TaxID=126673 RepID=UPI0013D2F146|nr:hypothetical protein [Mycolicibacterium doricum]MCV7267175.1 hypothetical protein [Mycolicibacterium doricum]